MHTRASPPSTFPPLHVGVRAAVGSLASVAAQLTQEHLSRCHLVLVTGDPLHPSFGALVSQLWDADRSYIGVSVGAKGIHTSSILSYDSSFVELFSRGDPTRPCRALLLLPASSPPPLSPSSFLANYTDTSVWSILDWFKLTPETRVVVVGGDRAHPPTHPRLSRTLHALHLATQLEEKGEQVVVSRLCHYCRGGGIGWTVVGYWSSECFQGSAALFPDTPEDMHGHRLRVVAKELFPYVCYNLPSSSASLFTSSSGPLIPCDSLDFRILDTAVALLNFTYEVWAPKDGKWGALVPGKGWDGIVGELLRDEADLSLRLFWSADRKMAIDFTRAYIFEPFVMVTRQPGPLQQSLALVRPFTGEVWAVLVSVTTATGVALWAVQGAWSRLQSGERSLDLGTSVLTSWGMLLISDTSTKIPSSFPARMTAGWWLVAVVVVTAMYRGSLIAHLTAPRNTAPLNTLEQLRELGDATWGLEGGYGVGWDWFKFNINPDVKMMFNTMQVTPREVQLAQVLRGPHAFFTWKYYIQTVLAAHYTDASGRHPFHIGTEELLLGQSGWGVRKNAPFLSSLDRVIGRLVEVGLIDHWLKELFPTTRATTNARDQQEDDAGDATGNTDERARQVLGLRHLQGAFYLLLVGGGGALMTFAAERVIKPSKWQQPG